jgi:hypothetical protein
VDGPRDRGGRSAARVVLREFIEFFTSSSFDRLDFVFRFARGLRTVREKIFRADSPRVVAGRSATPSRTVHWSHTESPHRLLQFRACASVLVCFLPLLVPRLLGGSFEVV